MLGGSTSTRRQDAAEIPVSFASRDFTVTRMDVRFEQRVNIKFKHNVTVLPHLPYSPDLSPCDFLFPRLKKRLKGRRHENIEAI
jgi:hypothetical protein